MPGNNYKAVSLDFILLLAHCTCMKLILSTHNVTLTKAIEDHILSRIDKLEHFDRFAVNARVTLEHDNTKAPAKQFSCSLRLAVRGPDLFAEDSESDLYAAMIRSRKKLSSKFASDTTRPRRAGTPMPPAARSGGRNPIFSLLGGRGWESLSGNLPAGGIISPPCVFRPVI